jgi:hypothetical protein
MEREIESFGRQLIIQVGDFHFGIFLIMVKFTFVDCSKALEKLVCTFGMRYGVVDTVSKDVL